MTKLVVMGAKLKCSQGAAPGTLVVPPGSGGEADELATATVDDFQPMTNVSTFGMCRSQANPQVASATAAAQGVLTPMPCVPVITAAWSPGSDVVTIGAVKVLTSDSTCRCSWSGTIEITDPGSTVTVDG